MKIVLVCAGPVAPGPAPAPAHTALPAVPVFCSGDPSSVDLATQWFPDQGIRASKSYVDPELKPGLIPRLLFALGGSPPGETHEQLKRRVVDLAIGLVDGAKKNGEAIFVGGPLMIRLVGYKLASIGYKGPLLSPVRPFRAREYQY